MKNTRQVFQTQITDSHTASKSMYTPQWSHNVQKATYGRDCLECSTGKQANVMAKDFMLMLDSHRCLLSARHMVTNRDKVCLQSNHSVSMHGADTGESMWSFHTMWTNWFCWNSHTHRETTHCSRRSAFVCFHAQKSGMVQEIYKLGKS